MALQPIIASVLALACLTGAPSPAHAAEPSSTPGVVLPGLEGELNVNTASAEQWMLLPRIGPATADRILRYREHHRFRRISHLMRVKGIGRKTYAKTRAYLKLEGDTTLRKTESPNHG